MSLESIKNKIKNKIVNTTFFRNMFGFESGIDITDEKQVLYRKNVVIKNIILLSNIFYTLLFGIITITEQSNFLLAALLFPVTFLVNYSLKKMLKKGPEDYMAQTIAMYGSCFYMFLSAIVIYVKLKNGSGSYLQECGYILLYYSLAICAFYQDGKMLKNICIWVVLLITLLHFFVTYPLASEENNPLYFLRHFFVSNEFKDILLRTILLIMFMLVLYINVKMANYMQEERKKELMKRRQVQENFTSVVAKIFDVTLLNTKIISDDERYCVELVAEMTKKLSSLVGLKSEEIEKIYNFARIHIDKTIHFTENSYNNEDENFEALRKDTELGSELISRLQLERKCEDIIRATFEGSVDDAFISKMREIQNNQESQIILICDLYVTMRSGKSYKKAYNHKLTMTYMKEQFKLYFDSFIFERFIRFNEDFEKLYDQM